MGLDFVNVTTMGQTVRGFVTIASGKYAPCVELIYYYIATMYRTIIGPSVCGTCHVVFVFRALDRFLEGLVLERGRPAFCFGGLFLGDVPWGCSFIGVWGRGPTVVYEFFRHVWTFQGVRGTHTGSPYHYQ